MKPAYIVIFILIIIAFLGANYYVFYRIWRMIPPFPAAMAVVIVCAAVLVSSFFLAMLARGGGLPVWLVSAFYRTGTSWIFISLYLLIAFLIADLLRVTHILPMEKVMYSNWLSLGVLAAVTALIFIAGNINYHNKKRVELAVETPAPMEKPVRVVAVSDLHLGYGIGRRELSRWVDLINREKADAILIAGDLVDSHPYPLRKGGHAGELRRLEAKHGVWLAPGNHEYISGIDESLLFIEEAGINVLRDSSVVIGGAFRLIGRDDMTNHKRLSLGELTGELTGEHPAILIDHQPQHLDDAHRAGIDVQISGHTHRGQVWPFTWITDAMFERSHGFLKKGGTHYWITSGLGVWGGKFRIGSRSEYIIIELTGRKPE